MNTMRTIFYDYKANIDLRLPSRERLLKRLGEYDTLAEYTACAVLDFEANWTGEGDYSDYVTAKAVQHNVNLKGGVQLDNYMNALYKSFMVNSHAMELMKYNLNLYVELDEKCPFPQWKSDLKKLK